MKKIPWVLFLFCLLSVHLIIFANTAELGDTDADGMVRASDARLVLRYAVGLETTLPALVTRTSSK